MVGSSSAAAAPAPSLSVASSRSGSETSLRSPAKRSPPNVPTETGLSRAALQQAGVSALSDGCSIDEVLLFMALGFGGSWTVQDGLGWDMEIFMGSFAFGEALPRECELAAMLGTATCLTVQLVFGILFRGRFGAFSYKLTVTCMQLASVGVVVALAAAWHFHRRGHAPVILAGSAIGSAMGCLVYISLLPMVGIFYKESLISAVIAGISAGSFISGTLALVQQLALGPRDFPPGRMFSILAVFQIMSVGAWVLILRHGVGRRLHPGWEDAPTLQHESPLPSPRKAAPSMELLADAVEEGGSLQGGDGSSGGGGGDGDGGGGGSSSGGGGGGSGMVVRGVGEGEGEQCEDCSGCGWVGSLMPVILLMSVNIAGCWSVLLSVLPLATAHASCSCDSHDFVARSTFDWASAAANLTMPLGAFLSVVAPMYAMKRLAALTVVQFVCLLCCLSGAAGAWWLTCSSVARGAIILFAVVNRLLTVYLTAMLYRVWAVRYADDLALQGPSSTIVTQAVGWICFVVAVLVYLTLRYGMLSCRVPPEFYLDPDLTPPTVVEGPHNKSFQHMPHGDYWFAHPVAAAEAEEWTRQRTSSRRVMAVRDLLVAVQELLVEVTHNASGVMVARNASSDGSSAAAAAAVTAAVRASADALNSSAWFALHPDAANPSANQSQVLARASVAAAAAVSGALLPPAL